MKWFLIFILLAPAMLIAQDREDDAVLATVGDQTITVGEFRARYALTVFPYKDQERLTPVVKRQFLYALIAERLLAQEARRRGFDAEDRYRRNRRMAEEMFVRDRLYRDSVRSRVTVSEAEVRQRFEEEHERIEFEFLFSTDEEDIRNLSRIMRAGVPFDTLLAQQRTMHLPSGTDESREASVEELADALDTLRPGQVSAPTRASDGWYLIRKVDYGNPIRSEYAFQKSFKRLENEIRTRKEAERAVAFMRGLWNGRQAQVERDPYAALGDLLSAHYRAQAAADTSNMLLADATLFDSLRSAWAVRLDAPFARLNGDVLTVGAALDRLQALDLRLKREEIGSFPALYRQRVRDLLDRFILTRTGYAFGLQDTDEVRHEVAMWAANGLAQMIPEMLWEQYIASDDSLWQFYARRPDLFGAPVEVKILEVLSADSAVIDTVRQRFARGAAMQDLAKEFSERDDARTRGGMLGWFPVTAYGVIGRTAFGMRIADAAGPLHTPEGWSFFQLVDRRYPGMRLDSWKSLRDSITAVGGGAVTRARTDQLLRRLAARTPISVRADLLDAVPVRSMQMFSIRYLGFGGRIPAMPSLMPLHEAVMEGMESGGQAVP